MHSTSSEQIGAQRRLQEQALHSPTNSRRIRSEGNYALRLIDTSDGLDSWIEVQPSSSDIITTGLQIRREDRQSRPLDTQIPPVRSTSVAGSSQDEYEESESESDRVLSSSNEDIAEDTAAALVDNHAFTPQPNAFSHPPNQSEPAPNSYFPARPVAYSDRLPSNRMITQRTIQRRPDHDEALRASLTTLLSCAAAVRPKEHERPAFVRASNQPTTLRLVSQSEMEKPAKRRPRDSSKERHAKKIRATKSPPEELTSPTITTWMISAGVVLVFSAISFSAGYAWGKEVGRFEEFNCGSCGREAIRSSGGLRKLRWTPTHSVRV